MLAPYFRCDDDDDYCPPCDPPAKTPGAHLRVVEAVVIAGLSAIATKIVEHVYERRFKKNETETK